MTMNQPNWLTYLGAVTGVAGMVTGIVGAVMGYIAYRRSGEMKALDLRLQLRKAESDLRDIVERMPHLIDEARGSRLAVTSALGTLRSGAVDSFKSRCESDIALARSLGRELPPADRDYLDSDYRALEARLVQVHGLTARAVNLRDRYLSEIAKDDKDREHIRASNLAHHAGPRR
jgi:hypothetical protein